MTPRMIQRRLSSGRCVERIGRAGYRLFDLKDPQERLRRRWPTCPTPLFRTSQLPSSMKSRGPCVGLAVVTVHTANDPFLPWSHRSKIARASRDQPSHEAGWPRRHYSRPHDRGPGRLVLDPRTDEPRYSTTHSGTVVCRLYRRLQRTSIEQVRPPRPSRGSRVFGPCLMSGTGPSLGSPLETEKDSSSIKREPGCQLRSPSIRFHGTRAGGSTDAYPSCSGRPRMGLPAHSTHSLGDFERGSRPRLGSAVIHGWGMLRFTWDDVTARPGLVVHQLQCGTRVLNGLVHRSSNPGLGSTAGLSFNPGLGSTGGLAVNPGLAGSRFLSALVAAGGDLAAVAGPVGVEELAPGAVDPLVGVGAEVVALRLDQVGGAARSAAVAVVEGQRGGVGGSRDPGRHRAPTPPAASRPGSGCQGLGGRRGRAAGWGARGRGRRRR